MKQGKKSRIQAVTRITSKQPALRADVQARLLLRSGLLSRGKEEILLKPYRVLRCFWRGLFVRGELCSQPADLSTKETLTPLLVRI